MKGSMTKSPDRRGFMAGALATGAALTVGAPRVFAQAASPFAGRDAQLAAIAQEQLARAGEVIWKKDTVGIADFGLHSGLPRFHLVYLAQGKVESFLVSHGTGSDPEHDGWLNHFSNIPGSEMTSSGAYITWEWYHGRFGLSMRLGGLDPSNDQAYPRAIVMHPAEYATQAHVDRWGRLGRSNGCFALGPEQFRHCVRELAGGRLLFAERYGLQADGTQVAPPPPPANPASVTLDPDAA